MTAFDHRLDEQHDLIKTMSSGFQSTANAGSIQEERLKGWNKTSSRDDHEDEYKCVRGVGEPVEKEQYLGSLSYLRPTAGKSK